MVAATTMPARYGMLTGLLWASGSVRRALKTLGRQKGRGRTRKQRAEDDQTGL